MSEADDGGGCRLYAEDMVAFAQQAVFYTHGMDQETLVADRRTYDATLRNIDVIWDIVQTDIPDLLVAPGHLLEQERA